MKHSKPKKKSSKSKKRYSKDRKMRSEKKICQSKKTLSSSVPFCKIMKPKDKEQTVDIKKKGGSGYLKNRK